MLFYRKNEQGDLTAAQTRTLARVVREEFLMKRAAFEQLVRSVRQAGRIRRGAKASRAFSFAPGDVKAIRKGRLSRSCEWPQRSQGRSPGRSEERHNDALHLRSALA
jgi:hypothetical protein